jgi:acetyltransferase-like isoleucine patch superfamily enzyme
MRMHEISYYDKTNIIEFFSEFCTHSKEIETTNKEKNIHVEKKSFLNQSNYFKFNDSNKNSRKFFMIVIKVLSRKEINFDQSAINLSEKEKKSTESVNRIENSKTIKDFRFNLNELKIFNSNEKLSEVNIAMIKTSTFNIINERKDENLFFVILKKVKKHFEKHNKSNIVIKNVFSVEYHEFLNVFDKITFNTFVSHRFYNHKIVLKKNAVFEYTFLYKMFEEKLKIVKKYLENNLEKRFIAANRSSFVSSVIFMKKRNESSRFCVDYKKLNKLIQKNKYFLSFIDETLTHLDKIKYFIKLNIRQTFHRIWIANAKFEDLIIFKTRFNACKYRVMSFELCNESVIYQHYMNDVFFEYLNNFVSIYINNIFIYSNFKKST